MIRVFIDESGIPDRYVPGLHQVHDKYFTLAAVIISQQVYTSFKVLIEAICLKYRQYLLGKEIKSNYIRTSNPKFLKLGQTPQYIFYQFPDGQVKFDEFCAEIKTILLSTDFKIISVTTNKEAAEKKWPSLSIQDYLFNDLWERLSIYAVINSNPRMRIMFDRTKGRNDILLKESYKKFKSSGSKYFNVTNLTTLRLDRDVYSCDSLQCRGLQLVDLMAYPIKKHLENRNLGKGPHDFFEKVVRGKLYVHTRDGRNGATINMGTKITLN